MVELVTLRQAKDHLRIDTDDGDNDLNLKINAASNAVLNYIKRSGIAYEYEVDADGDPILDSAGDRIFIVDSAGDKIPLPEVQSAVLIMLGLIYVDRDGQDFQRDERNLTLGELQIPRTVKWLLDPLRCPTMA